MDLVVFSDDWGRHPSSCQHLFADLARRHRVLWVNTIGMRAPKADGFTAGRSLEKLTQWKRPLRRINENLHVYSPAMLPITGDQPGAGLNASLTAARIRRVLKKLNFVRPVLFSSIPTGADYIGRLDESLVIYYITDNYELWPGASAETIAAQDRKLKAHADGLFPVGEALAEGLKAYPGKLVELPHAVDLDHFTTHHNKKDAEDATQTGEPADLAGIARPRMCFFGLIYEKIDLDLLARCAAANPDRSLVLIGPVKTDTAALAALPNVHILGAKSYAELPNYLNHCDVMLLAYKLDDQTRRNAPLKIRECLAVGKPIIARRIADLDRYGPLMHLADSEQQFIELFSRGDSLTADAEAMRSAIAEDTWPARARTLERHLEDLLRARNLTDGDAMSIDFACDVAQWERYVADRGGCVWHSRRWLSVMREAYGLETRALAVRRHGRVCGVLPLALQSSLAFGRHMVSLPWLDAGGIVADDDDARNFLLENALDLADQAGADLCLRRLGTAGDQRDSRVTGQRTDKVAMVLDLPDNGPELWRRVGAKVRNQVRKAEKSALLARWAGPAELELFYEVYSTNMRDLGSPPHSLNFFALVLEHFPELARIMLVMQDDQPVAAGLVLRDRRQWQIPWASSLRSYNHLCPNHLLYWSILNEACGHTGSFCFGRSSRGSGTYRFKAQWGCVEQPLCWDYWLGADGCDGRPSATAELISRAWRRVPVTMARRLGPKIIRAMG